jgi:hypothetical protein
VDNNNQLTARPMPLSYIGIWIVLSILAVGRLYPNPSQWSLATWAEFIVAVGISTALWGWIFWRLGLRKAYPFKR